jgi:hypothetical protein
MTYPSAKRDRFRGFCGRGLRLNLRQVCDLLTHPFEQRPGMGTIFVVVRYCPYHDIGYALLLQRITLQFPCICVIKRHPLGSPVNGFDSFLLLQRSR